MGLPLDMARHDGMSPRHILAVCLVVSMLGGCQTPPAQPEPVAPPPDAPEEPAGPCSELSPRELERKAIELLDRGEAVTAREQLDCALQLNPRSSRARSLVEQLDAEPLTYLGPVSYSYVVQSNETLSKIAQERLGSSLKFVILARYNDIDVPANLRAGQTIRIPGEEPVGTPPLDQEGDEADEAMAVDVPTEPVAPQPTNGASAAMLAEEALGKEDAGDLKGAYELITRAYDLDPSILDIEDDLSRIKGGLIGQLEEQAYTQELSGALQDAIDTWTTVLSIDPGNIPAQLSMKRLKTQLSPSP